MYNLNKSQLNLFISTNALLFLELFFAKLLFTIEMLRDGF